MWQGKPTPPLGGDGAQRPCLVVSSPPLGKKSVGPGFLNGHNFSLLPGGIQWTCCHHQFRGRLDDCPTSLLYLPMDPLPLQRLLHSYPITWPCPSLSPKGLTVYTLYIVPVPITSCRDLEPSNGESFICHFETYLLVRVLLFCPNCANSPSLACKPIKNHPFFFFFFLNSFKF